MYTTEHGEIMSIRDFIRKAQAFYPTSKPMRKQWVRKTIKLMSEGKHIDYGAKVKWGTQNPAQV
jgi:hypothetical protein